MYAQHTTHQTTSASQRNSHPMIGSTLQKILHRWLRNHTTRQNLARLTSEGFDDIGLTQAERAEEISKPFSR
ncbi:DUF1127 domain-containing protein [Aliiroseovarius sp. YM-037]|uniref:DUF1127 domain-containing protein n=1 Tax=Aliiroseovarius sp. YM-037 TaxID=3341728 RepID=UPI003A8072D2